MLTETGIRAAKPATKAKKLFDEKGLFLLVTPAGGRLWRIKYYFKGKEQLLALGKYPETSLKQARERRDEIRRRVADGVDPSAKRSSERIAQADAFEAIAREYLQLQLSSASAAHASTPPPLPLQSQVIQAPRKARPRRGKAVSAETVATALRRLEMHVFPFLGRKPIRAISPPELLTVLRRIEARGTHDVTHRIRAICGRVFRFAIATGRADRDIAADLIGALAPVAPQNFAAITDPVKIGELLRAIEGYQGDPTTQCALQLAPKVFVRPSELRKAEWVEFNLESDEPEWRIPAERMKMRDPHIVPLSRQAVELLRELQPLTGSGRFVFPSLRSRERPMSENCITAALRRMGYSGDEMTWHGFRSLASTQLNEQGWNEDWIEVQLAHGERNKIRGAYNWAKYLPQRRVMMQVWADYLDELRAGKGIVSTTVAADRATAAAINAFTLPLPYQRRKQHHL